MKKEEVLAECIEEVRSGKSTIEDCVARHPDLQKELSALLGIAAAIKTADVKPSQEFKLKAKRYLFEKMEEDPAPASRRIEFWPKSMLSRTVASTLAGLIVVGAAGGSVVYASQSSLPGDTLYTVKTETENLQLAITVDPIAKANLHLEFAQRRVDEVTEQVKNSREIDQSAVTSVTDQYNSAIEALAGANNTSAVNHVLSRMTSDSLDQQLELEQSLSAAPQTNQPLLQQTMENTQRGNTIAQVAYANSDFLKSHPSVSDSEFDNGPFHVEGTVISIQNDTWNIGGTIIKNIVYTGNLPASGSVVKIQGVVNNGKVYISNIDVNQNATQGTGARVQTTVEGQYNGTDVSGDANVGGIPIQIEDDNQSQQLRPGDKVQLQGSDSAHGKLKVTDRQNKTNSESGTVISGTLISVDPSGNTITLAMAGNQVTVNISEDQINNLTGEIGNNLTLSGVYKTGNSLYARSVQAN